jgi:hypothetical protein
MTKNCDGDASLIWLGRGVFPGIFLPFLVFSRRCWFFLAVSGFFLLFPVFSYCFRFFLAIAGFSYPEKTGFVQNPNPSMWRGEIKSLLCNRISSIPLILLAECY